MASEHPASDRRFSEVDALHFNDEDVDLHCQQHEMLLRIDGTGWLDRQRAELLRDWLARALR